MNYRISIYYRNAYAHFELIREANRIYTAELIHYDGCVEDSPPKIILLLRGIRVWWGSAEDKELVKVLGDYISSLSESKNFFTESNNNQDIVAES